MAASSTSLDDLDGDTELTLPECFDHCYSLHCYLDKADESMASDKVQVKIKEGIKMAEKVILYNYFRSSASWRVRIALAIKDIKYEYKAVHLVKDGGQQHSEEYKRLNPMEQVPTLVIDGHTLTQSLPIIEYLEERNPEPPLLPKDSFGRAQVRALSELINSGIQPLQNLIVLEKVGDGKEEWARSFIVKGFHALETLLKQTSGKYSYGDTVTMADLCLVPQMFAAKRFKVDLEPFPTICRVHDALAELSAFKAADASNQPDTPDELRST